MATPTPDSSSQTSALHTLASVARAVGFAAAVALLGWALIVINAQSHSLSRRTPTLDYMACHDSRQDKALEDTFAWIDDLAKEPPPAHSKIEHDHLAWILARAKLKSATNVGTPGACPPLPTANPPTTKPR